MNKTSERQARYDAKTARKIMLKLHKEHDKDIIDFVESKESMQGIPYFFIIKQYKSCKKFIKNVHTVRFYYDSLTVIFLIFTFHITLDIFNNEYHLPPPQNTKKVQFITCLIVYNLF